MAEVIAKLQMNASNPYESPSTTSESPSWRPTDFFGIGLWIAIPIVVFLGRQLLLPVFEEFEVRLPAATQILLHFYAPYLFAMASVAVILTICTMPYGRARRRFVTAACVLGVLTGVVCLISLLGPLFSLWQDLS